MIFLKYHFGFCLGNSISKPNLSQTIKQESDMWLMVILIIRCVDL
jgi:hypothetical protein